jgi:hypothetical protein
LSVPARSFTMAVAWQTSFAIGTSPDFYPSRLFNKLRN